MDYLRAEELSLPPPLDDISSADGTECEYEDYDLEVNAVISCTATSIAPKQYKSFQPAIKLQPTDLVYREEHSRAAPRKGIEPKAFLTIGATKQEHVEYVGRQKQPVTAPSKQARQTVSAVQQRKHQQRQSSTFSAPPTNRLKSRVSRTASGKGRQSGWSSAAYTPLPVAPPPTIPPKENTYLHHPFKQDIVHDTQKLNASTFEQHMLATMDEFVTSMAHQSLSRCTSVAESRRPVSPGEELKNSSILATMEVGRYINQREKSPKVSPASREPKLLKARLRPLNTVNVTGPSIADCQGVQADHRKFGPSPMRAKQQKQLDDLIKKNAALKDMSVAHYGSRTSSSKDSRRKSSGGSKVRLKTPDSSSSAKREPTPSPYSSITQLDRAGAIAVSSQIPDVEGTGARPSRAQSATYSEASHTEQQTMARSVSAVTIRHKEIATPASQQSLPAGTANPAANEDARKGTVFMTDADSTTLSDPAAAKAATYPQRKPPAAPKQQGCKDFEDTKASDKEDDDDKDKPSDRLTLTQPANLTTVTQNGVTSQNAQQPTDTPTNNGKQNCKETKAVEAEENRTNNISTPADGLSFSTSKPKVALHGYVSSGPTHVNNKKSALELKMAAKQLSNGSTSKQLSNISASKRQQYGLEEGCMFITAGFLTLESMINDARNMLRHSYSLNDLDKLCDWDQPISSPRSVEVLNKEVKFADKHDSYCYYPSEKESYMADDLSLVEHKEPKLDLLPVKEPLLDAFPCDKKSSDNVKIYKCTASPTLDSIQRELAVLGSPYGIHGQISDYLTTCTLIREIYPPPANISKPKATCSTYAPVFDLSACGTQAVDCVPLNPPTTPRLGPSDGTLTPVSECFTPDDSGSVFSDWDLPADDGKCFLETFIDLLPEDSKVSQLASEDSTRAKVPEPLPEALEGHAKPVTIRQNPGAVEPIASVPPACFRVNCVPAEGQVFYFTYDADLNHNRFSTLIGRPVSDKRWAVLFGFQLVFNKQGLDSEAGSFPNIEANPYSSVEGAVYSLSHDELVLVDGHHGYPSHYTRIIAPVWMCNSTDPDNYCIAQYCVPAVTYIAQEVWVAQHALPASSKEYSLRQVIKGANQLSTGFRGHLTSMLQECCC